MSTDILAKKQRGSVQFRHGRWYAQAFLFKGKGGRLTFELTTCRTEEEANARGAVIADLSAKLKKAGATDVAKATLTRAASATAKELGDICRLVDGLSTGSTVAALSTQGMTYQEFSQLWTGGDLHKRYPDQVRAVADDTTAMYGRKSRDYIYPLVGSVRLVDFTVEHADRVMRALPSHLASATRWSVAQIIRRVLDLAVFPMKVIERNPIPKGWMPKISKPRAKAFLYPTEDAQLLACTDIALGERVLFGFLSREGTRGYSEALALTWSDFDLDRGSVVLDQNKTGDHGRAWALGADVAESLRRWRKLRGNPDADGPVFTHLDGSALSIDAEMFRRRLRKAGLTRAQLFEHNDHRKQIDVHALRSTFVTLAAAVGRSETWICDRTGHRSSQMMARYRRGARMAAELQLGWLHPMHETIPELAKCSTSAADSEEDGGKGSDSRELPQESVRTNRSVDGGEGELNAQDHGTSLTDGPAPAPSAAPQIDVAAPADAVEAALATALERASAAGEWTTVAAIAGELAARREAHAVVVRLDDVRKRRRSSKAVP